MKILYLAAAIVGAIVPYAFFVQFFGSDGLNISVFVSALFANPAAASISPADWPNFWRILSAR